MHSVRFTVLFLLFAGTLIQARDREWPYSTPRRHPIPATKEKSWSINWIDSFLLAKLESKGIRPTREATSSAILRRLHFVLHGLPPSAEQTRGFEQAWKQDPNLAISDKLDELLDDVAFGERFGRHWLDVARYADSNGGGANRVFDNAWRYRDYVIRSFADDKPFDLFVREQLAGDLLKTGHQAIVATGFLSIGPKEVAEYDKDQLDLDVTDEQLDTIGRAFMGLTFGCARCHDHKFDPVSQSDYYAMAGILMNTETLLRKNAGGPLSVWHKKELSPKRYALAPRDRPEPKDMHLLIRGDRHDPGKLIRRGTPQIFDGGELDVPSNESGRRQLAEWMTDPKHPMTSRVMVNRIWQWCLGEGIVRTVDNFGARGDEPTHRELLDTLAVEFVEKEWSVKHLVRLILSTRTFQLASHPPAKLGHKDPGNQLLSHAHRRRLDAESLRDAILHHAGTLDRHVGGETLTWKGRLDEGQAKRVKDKDVSQRRAVYQPRFRGFAREAMLTAFDVPEPSLVTGKRAETLQPAQALVLLNSPLVKAACFRISERWLGAELYLNLYGRSPTRAELISDEAFLKSGGSARDLVQSMIAANEFLYVD
ncbi:MAG: DUF1549 and DUF1553 domain-containing protein [Limisphaerales bacterium]